MSEPTTPKSLKGAPAETHAATEVAETHDESVLGTFGVDPGRLAGQAINFVIVAVVLWLFVFKPVVAKLDARAATVAQGLKDAEDAQKRLADAEREEKTRFANAEKSALRITENATKHAEEIKRAKLAETKAEVEGIVDDARRSIRAEKEHAYRSLQKELATLVTAATEKVVKNLDPETRKHMVEDALREMDKTL